MQKLLPALCVAVLLSGCSSLNFFDNEPEKDVLEGTRLSLYDFEKTLRRDPNTQFGLDGSEGETLITLSDLTHSGQDQMLRLDRQWTNKFWPQVGGYPNHAMKNLAFNKEGNPVEALWSASIGKGASSRMPLTAAPVVADGRVYTTNNDAKIMAFDTTNGKKLWTTDILKKGEDEVVIGGGLGFSGGKLFATNGYNEIIAIDPSNGQILWRSNTKNPVRAAPSAIPGYVFVTTMNNETIAFDTNTGKKLWIHRGLSSHSGVLGASTPALTRDAVITAYDSGEVYALQINTGTELWSQNLSPLSHQSSALNITDIRALPVVHNNTVYVASYNDRIHAIDLRTGQPKWKISVGALNTPWVSGNRLFVITKNNDLISINSENGTIMWQNALFQDGDKKDNSLSWQGPMIAGEHLVTIGSNGMMQFYNPVDGTLVKTQDMRTGSIGLSPALANEVLYSVSDSGRLTAFK